MVDIPFRQGIDCHGWRGVPVFRDPCLASLALILALPALSSCAWFGFDLALALDEVRGNFISIQIRLDLFNRA